jgi:hypothetical protein
MVMRCRMSAVSVVPKVRLMAVRPVVSVRWLSAAAMPSAQTISNRMMMSKRRVAGVTASALAPAGAAVEEEREAGARMGGIKA